MVGSMVRVLARALVTLVLAITVAFVLSRLSGDPVRNLMGPLAPQDQVDRVSEQLGYTRPLLEQYWSMFSGLLTGDLGTSLQYDRSAVGLILGRLPATMELAAVAMAIALIVGIPVGIYAAFRENRAPDRIATGFAALAQSVPPFWLGMMLILVFAVRLQWLPSSGRGSATSVILPALALSGFVVAQIIRLTKSAMAEVLRERYILLARAHGITGVRLALVHALRNAALPVVTLIGLQMGVLLSGAVAVEYVFAWPGIGLLTINAVTARDVPLVQAVVIVGATIFVLVNLIVDISYGLLDPRTRTSAGSSR